MPEFKGVSLTDATQYIENHLIGEGAVHPNPSDKITGDSNESLIINEGARFYDIKFTTTVPNVKGKIDLIINI